MANFFQRYAPVFTQEEKEEALKALNNWPYNMLNQQGAIDQHLAKREPEARANDKLQGGAEAVAVALPEAPQPAPVAVSTGYDAEYAALAEKVGFECPELVEQKLLNFLHENGYSTYDYARVCGYMDGLMRKLTNDGGRTQNYSWLWRPLRQRDVIRSETVYARPVPMPVLQTVAAISEKLPDVQFHVSDYEGRKPDPFLAVSLPGMNTFIVIERWDEPAFR